MRVRERERDMEIAAVERTQSSLLTSQEQPEQSTHTETHNSKKPRSFVCCRLGFSGFSPQGILLLQLDTRVFFFCYRRKTFVGGCGAAVSAVNRTDLKALERTGREGAES